MKSTKSISMVIFLMIFLLTTGLSFADRERDDSHRKYEVTITNLTRGQVFSPPIVIVHNRDFNLFKFGDAASVELAALAEEGDPEPLAILIDNFYPKFRSAVAGGPIPPGESASVILKISKRGRSSLISVAGMLVTTNDAFFAGRNIWLPGRDKVMVEAEAYDAGSEENTEECNDIPGPPCGAPPNLNPTDGAEGYVHVHAGIHGSGSEVNPADHDWNNPVAKITIRRIYH